MLVNRSRKIHFGKNAHGKRWKRLVSHAFFIHNSFAFVLQELGSTGSTPVPSVRSTPVPSGAAPALKSRKSAKPKFALNNMVAKLWQNKMTSTSSTATAAPAAITGTGNEVKPEVTQEEQEMTSETPGENTSPTATNQKPGTTRDARRKGFSFSYWLRHFRPRCFSQAAAACLTHFTVVLIGTAGLHCCLCCCKQFSLPPADNQQPD